MCLLSTNKKHNDNKYDKEQTKIEHINSQAKEQSNKQKKVHQTVHNAFQNSLNCYEQNGVVHLHLITWQLLPSGDREKKNSSRDLGTNYIRFKG